MHLRSHRLWVATALLIPAWLASAVLLLFHSRRLVYLLAAVYDLWASRPHPLTRLEAKGSPDAHRSTRELLILVPMRNEAASLPSLVDCLLALDYPESCRTIGLIDDGSTDGTGELIDSYAAAHSHVCSLHTTSPAGLGKADALNAGLARWPQGEIVVVYDADSRPRPDSLAQIVGAFDDLYVAAAGGLVRPSNGLVTPVATYSAIERLVHQHVTLRAKDRLKLAPAILGSNCAYRRRDLEMVGGFPGGAYLEDSQLTVDLARLGRGLRFLPGAVAQDSVPETLAGYWRQHVRWGRGFHDVAKTQLRQRRVSQCSAGRETGEESPKAGLLLRLELWLFALGYLDRLALVLGAWLMVAWRVVVGQGWPKAMRLLAAMVGLTFLLPYAQIVLTLLAERATRAWWLRTPLVPLLFLVDTAAAVWSLMANLSQRPRAWQPTERTVG